MVQTTLSIDSPTLPSTEQRLLEALRASGPFSLDALSTLFDMSWAQAFLLIDRLSRSRHVRLHRTEARTYLVSINNRPTCDKAAGGAPRATPVPGASCE